jgi:type II secretory ATPase GspE/PulE/Tfp pilus assembly ATPase PilB-like protein
VAVPDDLRKRLNEKLPKGTKFYRGKGCEACSQTGYHGRLGLTELLEVDDTMRDMLIQGKSSDEIKNYARKEKGMITLWDDAINKCLAGITSLEEVMRITTTE